MKIGIGGLHIESCTFSPLLSQAEDFRILRGEELLASYPFLDPGIIHVPILHARALPGGPVDAGFYQQFKSEFLEALVANQPFDGLFLPMHGAVSVDGMQDAEGDLLAAVRKVVGPDCFIAASYDLHGNVSHRVIENVNFLSAYRTAPHVDVPDTLQRVYRLLLHCLRAASRPYKVFIPVPILFSGEKTSTEWEPAASLYKKIPDVISDQDVLDASILIGYVWADEPRSTACVVAYGMDREKTRSAGKFLAQQFWEVREQFQFGVTADSTDRCIQIALDVPEQPVIISDAGDNPTAGGAGDTPYVLARLLALGAKNVVFAGIADAQAVRTCWTAGVGSAVELSLGGKLDPVHAQPLQVKGQVVSLHAIPWALNSPGAEEILNQTAVVDVQGIRVVVTERRTVFHRMIDFTNLGIDPHQAKIIVVKIGYLEPELKAMAKKALLALSPGAVNPDTEKIDFRYLQHPMYPFDREFQWSPEV